MSAVLRRATLLAIVFTMAACVVDPDDRLPVVTADSGDTLDVAPDDPANDSNDRRGNEDEARDATK